MASCGEKRNEYTNPSAKSPPTLFKSTDKCSQPGEKSVSKRLTYKLKTVPVKKVLYSFFLLKLLSFFAKLEMQGQNKSSLICNFCGL